MKALQRPGALAYAAALASLACVVVAVGPLAPVALPFAAVLAGSVAAIGVAIQGQRVRLTLFFALLAVTPVVGGWATEREATFAGLRLVDEVVLGVGLLLLADLARRLEGRERDIALLALALLLASEVGGLLWGAGWATRAGAAWQDLRWLGVIGWGTFVGARLVDPRKAARWGFILLLGWNLASILASLIEIAQLSGPGVVRYGIPQTVGAFGHPSYGSVAAGALVIFSVADRFSPRRLLPESTWGVGVAVGMAALVASTRAKPLLAIAVAVAFVLLAGRFRRGVPVLVVAVGLLPVVMLPTLSYLNVLSQERSGAAALSQESHVDTRITLVHGAVTLAKDSFPAGHGLGTFGSRLDPQAEFESIFQAGIVGHGLGRGEVNFISDSLVAHVVAERGFLGFGLWTLGLMVVLWLGVLLGRGSLIFAGGFAGAIAIVGVSPAFHSPPDILMLLLPAAFVLGAGSAAAVKEGD